MHLRADRQYRPVTGLGPTPDRLSFVAVKDGAGYAGGGPDGEGRRRRRPGGADYPVAHVVPTPAWSGQCDDITGGRLSQCVGERTLIGGFACLRAIGGRSRAPLCVRVEGGARRQGRLGRPGHADAAADKLAAETAATRWRGRRRAMSTPLYFGHRPTNGRAGDEQTGLRSLRCSGHGRFSGPWRFRGARPRARARRKISVADICDDHGHDDQRHHTDPGRAQDDRGDKDSRQRQAEHRRHHGTNAHGYPGH